MLGIPLCPLCLPRRTRPSTTGGRRPCSLLVPLLLRPPLQPWRPRCLIRWLLPGLLLSSHLRQVRPRCFDLSVALCADLAEALPLRLLGGGEGGRGVPLRRIFFSRCTGSSSSGAIG